MPIEIKELLIKIHVNDTQPKIQSTPTVDHVRIVQESVDQVVELLKQQKER